MGAASPAPLGLRVGTDLVAVADVARSLEQFGPRYTRRLFTEGERTYAESAPSPKVAAERYAARFASKEAALKVLAPDVADAVPWSAIEVTRGPSGAPSLTLHGSAWALARRRGLTGFALSMAHEAAYATAVVVAYAGTCPAPQAPEM